MQVLRIGLISVSAGLLVAACGGSSEGSSSGPIEESQFIPQLTDAICEIGSCCAAAGYDYDREACKTLYRAGLKDFFGSTPNTTYDAAAGGRCLDAVRAYAASCGANAAALTKACEGVVQGTLPDGAVCESSGECAAPSRGQAYCNGTCVQMPRGGLGDACDSTCQERDGGLSCWSGGTAGGDAGGPAECYVNDGLSCQAGKCAPTKQVGEACDWVDCELGAFCSSEAGTCVTTGKEGAQCASSEQCASGFFCEENSGRCKRSLPRGAACSDYDACGADGDCIDGACGPRFPTEEACAGAMP